MSSAATFDPETDNCDRAAETSTTSKNLAQFLEETESHRRRTLLSAAVHGTPVTKRPGLVTDSRPGFVEGPARASFSTTSVTESGAVMRKISTQDLL